MKLKVLFLGGLLFLAACEGPKPEPVAWPTSPEDIARGKAIVTGLAACGYCHGEKAAPGSTLSGGREIEDTYGAIAAGNITPSESGVGNWDPQQVARAIRASVDKDDERFSPDVHDGFQWMSDADVLAAVAYLRTLPPVDKEISKRSVGFIERNTLGFMDVRREVKGYVPEIDPRYSIQYGEYLADNVARCGYCHNSATTILSSGEYLVGGKTIKSGDEEKIAPGISNSKVYGIGTWSDNDLLKYLKTGQTPDGKESDPNFCPIRFYQNAPERDLVAIAQYLKSLPE